MVRARKATKSLRSKEHQALRSLLIAARRKAGLRQAQLAERLGKPQSYVSKYEGGERRLDLIEFVRIARAIGADPIRIMRAMMRELS